MDITRRICVLDTTLRDGEQTPGVNLNLQEKLEIARQLDALGVDVIEAGFPAASSGDFQAVRAVSEQVSCAVAALCRCVEDDIRKAHEALLPCKKPRLHLFIATSEIHMRDKLKMEPEQVLQRAVESIRLAHSLCDDVEFSCEDASRSDPEFLCRVLEAAIDAGATTVNVPDTVGYALPDEFGALIRTVRQRVPNIGKAVLSVHCHNDLGLAAANTVAALQNGAEQIETTINGLGERAGNCAMEEVIMGISTRSSLLTVSHGINIRRIYRTSQRVAKITGVPLPICKAVVGVNAFSHQSGIHQHGVLSNPMTYEIMTPQSIGRTQNDLVLGKHSGRSAIKNKLTEMGYCLTDEQIQTVFEAVKQLADKKKQIFDEDLSALVLENVFRMPDSLELIHLSVQSSDTGTPPMAAVVMDINGTQKKHADFGVGPIDAVFNVIATITERQPELNTYTVSSISGGTDALGEVTVRISENGCTAVGRSSDADIITASAKAFVCAMNRLLKKEKEQLEQAKQ